MRTTTSPPLAVRRYWTGENLTAAFIHPVVEATDVGYLMALRTGDTYWRIRTRHGLTQYQDPVGATHPSSQLTAATWCGVNALIAMPKNEPFALYTFWDAASGVTTKLYCNLQLPYALSRVGPHVVLNSMDLALDIEISPDGVLTLKEEAELTRRTGMRGYWNAAGEQRIRAFAARFASNWHAGRFHWLTRAAGITTVDPIQPAAHAHLLTAPFNPPQGWGQLEGHPVRRS